MSLDLDLYEEAIKGSPLDYEERRLLLDSLYCTFHNRTNDLVGNRAESDIVWFARLLWEAEDDMRIGWHFDQVLSTEERSRYLRIAEAALKVLPRLMDRIAHRCNSHAAALRTRLRAEHAAKQEPTS